MPGKNDDPPAAPTCPVGRDDLEGAAKRGGSAREDGLLPYE